MLPDRVSNPGPLTYESGALPIALRGPAFACWASFFEGARYCAAVISTRPWNTSLRMATCQSRSRDYKTFFMLNSFEHEILNAHKCKHIKKFSIFQAQISLECYFSCLQMLRCQHLLAF